jgi:hypothetical protein
VASLVSLTPERPLNFLPSNIIDLLFFLTIRIPPTESDLTSFQMSAPILLPTPCVIASAGYARLQKCGRFSNCLTVDFCEHCGAKDWTIESLHDKTMRERGERYAKKTVEEEFKPIVSFIVYWRPKSG